MSDAGKFLYPPVRCTMCNDLAVAVFSMPGGCVCRPDDRQQALCMTHALKSRPLAGMVMIQDLTANAAPELDRWRT